MQCTKSRYNHFGDIKFKERSLTVQRAKIVRSILLVLSTSLFATTLMAEDNSGRIKANTCVGCHGIEGYQNAYPRYRVPRIAGQHQAYIESALKAYRSGKRKHPTMALQAESLSDQDIQEIAAYVASVGKK